MGLDMYLLKKGEKPSTKQTTGACGGLFPFTINSEGMEEIGYWRKNYRLADLLTDMLFDSDEEDNCVKKELTQGDCEAIISFAEGQLEFIDEDNDDGWYEADDWTYTIDTFKQALKELKQGNRIFYEQWY